MSKETAPINQDKDINLVTRNYNLVEDARSGIRRLISSFSEDKKAEAGMFETIEVLLNKNPDLIMAVIRGSIDMAKIKLSQDRSSGSSATLFYPIETATKLIALKNGEVANPFSSKSWNVTNLALVFKRYSKDIIELAGSNTTSLNLPQRAGHILWMIDQIETIPELENFTFLEIGASAGLILDALKKPGQFLNWMISMRYATNFGRKTKMAENLVMGLDLVVPGEDWIKAVVPGDNLRAEVIDFMSKFARSKVIQADATKLNTNIDVLNHFNNRPSLPFIYSCSAFYQMPVHVRNDIRKSVKALLTQFDGGYFMITDFASNMGFPDVHVGSASWVENHKGEIVSPKIITSGQTLTNWTVVEKI